MLDFNSALYRIVGERIRLHRCEHGLSQEQLAQKTSLISNTSASVSRASISNIEVGRHQAPLHVLSLLSKALRTEMHYLLPTSNEVLDYLESEVINRSVDNNQNILELLQKKNLEANEEKTLQSIFKTL
jgi:transcriptional regulator with XRE-family HTH domain